MKNIIIVGGGIVGQFSAYYLAKYGHDVTIIDDQPSMPPASVGNCGLITPSHVLPMNSMGTLVQGLKWLGKRDAPLSIKPQFDRAFLRWFASFIWHSKPSSIAKATEARHQLLQTSWSLYQDFFKNESTQCEWKHQGMVYVALSEKGVANMHHEVEVLHNHHLASRTLTREEIWEMEPLVTKAALGGAIFECDGWLKPGQLLADVREINKKNGVTFVNAAAMKFSKKGGKITSVVTANGEVTAEEYLLAAGAKSVFLARPLGINLRMIPGKGYNLTINSPLKKQPQRPIYMHEKKVVATPWDSGFRLGSTMEFSGFNLDLNTSRLDALKIAASEYLEIDMKDIEFTPWAGWRPMTSDSIPMIQRASGYKNLVLATGHGMLGLSMGPATGQMIADLINANE